MEAEATTAQRARQRVEKGEQKWKNKRLPSELAGANGSRLVSVGYLLHPNAGDIMIA